MQWFPGHMAKSMKALEAIKNDVDFVIELVDSRAPQATSNSFLLDIFKGVPIITVLTKASLTDKKRAHEFAVKQKTLGHDYVLFDSVTRFGEKPLLEAFKKITEEKRLKAKSKGMLKPEIKAVVIGIPNVGKSTFINFLKGRKVLKVENRPGVTKTISPVKTDFGFQIYDTPGILPPKITNEVYAVEIALCLGIKKTQIDTELVVLWLLEYLEVNYPVALTNRYKRRFLNFDFLSFLNEVGKSIGLMKNGQVEYGRLYERIINDFQKGYLGELFLERVRTGLN